MRASRRGAIRYAARIWREGKPDLSVHSRDLGKLRTIATRKLRQHLSHNMAMMAKRVEAGACDPLALAMAAETKVVQDAWGGALRNKGRLLLANGWGASYHIVVD